MNPFIAIRAGYGAMLLLAPGRPGRVVGLPPDRTALAVVRILGARHVAQAVASIGASSRSVQALGAEVDALHSASMLGLAAVDPAHRRAGLLDALVAACFAGAGAFLAVRQPADRASSIDGRDPLREPVGVRGRIATGIVRRTLPAVLVDRLRTPVRSTRPARGTSVSSG